MIWGFLKDKPETERIPDGPIVWKWVEIASAVLVSRATSITLRRRGGRVPGYRVGPWESWLVRFNDKHGTHLHYVREKDLITEEVGL